MKLPFPFFQNNKEERSEYYLALLLTDEKSSAVILKETNGQLKALGNHEEFFTTSLEESTLEELITLVDKTISKAEMVLPPDIQTNKTVFGVKDTWVEPDTKKITKDNLTKLKRVCDSLDLTPIGFMVVSEAIAHLLQEEEGAPLSAILAEVGRKTVTLTLLRGGKVAERIDGPLSDSAPATVDTLLKHFTTAVLPARLIIYDGKEAEKLSQEFIVHQWSKSLPFLHVPQITVLPTGFDSKAVTFGASEQMGFELLGVNLKTPLSPSDSEEHTTEKNESESVEEKTEEDSDYVPSKRLKRPLEEENEEETDEEPEDPSAGSGQDRDDEKEENEEQHAKSSLMNGDNFGFVTDADITKTNPPLVHEPKQHHETNTSSPSRANEEEEANEEVEADNFSEPKKANPLAFLSMIKLPKLPLPAMKGNKRFILPISIIVGLLILLGGLNYYYNNSVHANIVLSVKPKIVNQDATVTFSGTSSSDFSKNVIAAKSLTTTVDGSMTIDTTGKKDVGNKAKGTVTIYNNDNNSTTLENGTAIKASNGTVFLLDKSVSVASASGDIFSGTKPGTADVAVTARDIGTEGNLPSGTKFTIGSNSSLAAKNDSAFSGGSKKQVQVVSKNDVAKLRAELPKSLEAQAKDAIAQKAGGDETILPFITVVNLSKTNFDNDVDEEAKKVKLTATVTFEGLAYNNDEIVSYAKSLLKSKYSQDISDSSIKNTISDPEEKKDAIEANLAIEAGLLPDIDTSDVVSKVEKMSLKDAKTFLNGLPQVAENKITFSPGIPLLPNLFPHLPSHISIEVRPE